MKKQKRNGLLTWGQLRVTTLAVGVLEKALIKNSPADEAGTNMIVPYVCEAALRPAGRTDLLLKPKIASPADCTDKESTTQD